MLPDTSTQQAQPQDYYAADDSFIVQTDDIAGTAIVLETSSAGDGVFDTTFTTIDYQLEPLNGKVDGLDVPFTQNPRC
jgi:hypothetical protein